MFSVNGYVVNLVLYIDNFWFRNILYDIWVGVRFVIYVILYKYKKYEKNNEVVIVYR